MCSASAAHAACAIPQDKTSSRPFTNVSSVRKATIMTRVMQLIFDVLRKGIHVTKRDLFYTDVKLFQDQARCGRVCHLPAGGAQRAWI